MALSHCRGSAPRNLLPHVSFHRAARIDDEIFLFLVIAQRVKEIWLVSVANYVEFAQT
jgi:hypothetical protein